MHMQCVLHTTTDLHSAAKDKPITHVRLSSLIRLIALACHSHPWRAELATLAICSYVVKLKVKSFRSHWPQNDWC